MRSSEKEMLEFIETRAEKDTFEISDDLTEDKIDQAIFESAYSKPDEETDEFKSI